MSTQPQSVVKLQTWKIGLNGANPVPDLVAAEEPLEIRLVHEHNGEAVSTRVSVTMRTPGSDFELAVGFLYTEGIIPGPDAVTRVSYCVDVEAEQQFNVVNVSLRPDIAFDASRFTRNFFASSSCGVCGKASLEALRVQGCRPAPPGRPVVDAEVLCGLPEKLRGAQPVFQATGGLHAAALFDSSGALLTLREDVGRHNAVDKVIGHHVLKGQTPLSDRVLLVSGRAGFEIVQKAAVAGVPVMAAVGAPSSLAVQTAQEFGMTLVAFLKPSGFNVYTGAERVRGAGATFGHSPGPLGGSGRQERPS
jgi:FdhD protein